MELRHLADMLGSFLNDLDEQTAARMGEEHLLQMEQLARLVNSSSSNNNKRERRERSNNSSNTDAQSVLTRG